jgi:toxin ParE1/3/4
VTRWLLTPAAQADIDAIWAYSAERWGTERAIRYVLTIRAALDGLVEGNSVSRSAEHVRPGYRKHLVGSHVVFFRLQDGDLHVVRILHQHMDVDGQLAEG